MYEIISIALFLLMGTVASLILKWKKPETTRTHQRVGCSAKHSNQVRRVLEVNKNPVVNLTEPQKSSVEMGESVGPSYQHSINQAFMVEWLDRSHFE